ncbi:DJ-1/PfpI family protein [Patescibacteria group bacterium]
MTNLTGKKIAMVIAPVNFRDEELLQPKKILEKKGAVINIASKGVSEATGMLGAKVKVDSDLGTIKAEDYDAIVFIGGSGANIYFNDLYALDLVKNAVKLGKIVGAICIAPSILANAGVLRSKRATAFNSEIDVLRKSGAAYVNNFVVKDGNIITAKGPTAAKAFGEELLKALMFNHS